MIDTKNQKSQGAAPQAGRSELLNQCRGKVIDGAYRMVAALQTALLDESAQDTLPAPDIALRAEIAARWPEAAQAFRRAFDDFYEEQVRFAESSRLGRGYDFSASSLKLLDDAELEFTIELGDASQRLRDACEAELYKLDLRTAYLLDMPELDEERQPLGVAAAVYALRLLVEHLGGSLSQRLWSLRRVERKLEAELPALYAAVNVYLVQYSILPRISATVRRQDERAAPAGMRPDAAGAPQDALAQLRQALSARGGAAPVASESQGRGGAATGNAAAAALNALMDSLTRLQRQGISTGAPSAASYAGNETDLLQAMRGGAFAPTLAGLEPSTVDLVAALFDGIFEDPEIPQAAKSALGWLQIPVLKLALGDADLLSESGHPARHLLDAVGRLSTCIDDTAGEDHAVLRAIKTAVARIRDEFDRDPSVFDQALQDLDPCSGGVNMPGYLAPQVLADAVAHYRRKAASDAVAAGVIEPALRRQGPAVVKAFLDEQWRAVLSQVHAAVGEQHDDWRASVKLVEDLLWSAEPGAGADRRKRLLALLPPMLKRLDSGLALIGAPQADRERFLDALFALHSKAMKGGVQPAAQAATKSTAADEGVEFDHAVDGTPARASPDEEFATARQKVGDVEVVSLYRKRPTAGQGRVVAEQGDCIVFHLPGHAPQRACLCWDKGGGNDIRVLVFISAVTPQAFVVSAALLASLLRGNVAKWMTRDSLVQRAVSRKLESLRAATG